MNKLFFGYGNAKLSDVIATFSLPAGWTCPSANECLCKSNRATGLLTDGPKNKFRCFAASQEALFPSVRNSRWKNFERLKEAKSVQAMADLIHNSLPMGVAKVRVHVSGDFFSETYFKAWLNVAAANPALIFYGYTKQLQYLVKYRKVTPENFRFVASRGGVQDKLIEKYNLVSAEVVFSTEEARRKGLEIDHDDSHAIAANKSFALLLHGTQPKDSAAGEAWAVIKRLIGGYNAKKKNMLRTAKPIDLVVA
jgi:hypothetical protein